MELENRLGGFPRRMVACNGAKLLVSQHLDGAIVCLRVKERQLPSVRPRSSPRWWAARLSCERRAQLRRPGGAVLVRDQLLHQQRIDTPGVEYLSVLLQRIVAVFLLHSWHS